MDFFPSSILVIPHFRINQLLFGNPSQGGFFFDFFKAVRFYIGMFFDVFGNLNVLI